MIFLQKIKLATAFCLIGSTYYQCGNSRKLASTAITNSTATTTTTTTMPTLIAKPEPNGLTDAWLYNLLQNDNTLKNILPNKKEYQTQIIYTQIDRDENNVPKFTPHYVNYDPNFYYYPASMVKMPIAVLALQKIKELNAKGIAITKETTMVTETATALQTAVYNDPNSADGKPTIANYIKKIFLVSDNDAYNRLYEFLGQEYINSNLQRLGFKNTEILHRLSVSLTADENRHTNPLKFIDANGKIVYEQPAQYNKKKYSKRNDKRGIGYMQSGKLVKEQFDFSGKNRMNLQDLNDVVSHIIFGNVAHKTTFDITETDRNFILQYMSQLPRETTYPSYLAPEYYDTYCKFLLYGSNPKTTIPNNIRIFNKVGDAYGYFTDAAYIIDTDANIEYMVSATIYANKDGIFNDDVYEMESVALPFFKSVGEVLYNYEKTRVRKNKPNLDGYKLVYGGE